MTDPIALAQLRHLYQNMVNGAVRDTASAKRIAEGLLAPAIETLERGTPQAVAGEHKPGCPALGGYGHGVEECCCGATPQPTQAQAGAVPLTDEQIQEAILPINPHGMGYLLRIARAIERAHGIGIKGGQHGTDT